MIKTRITDMLGIDHPVVCGGMMWVGRAELASAVSNAGGLGMLTALTQATPEDLRDEIERCKTMTDRPFGVNLTILHSIVPRPYEEYRQAIIEGGVKAVETVCAKPQEHFDAFKAHGVTIIHKCTSARHALTAERLGADIISIDGFECAGHPGEDDVPGLVLIPATVDKVKIPVIASGGIGDGRGLVAALALGAEGVNMGTRFCATVEAPIHDNIKQLLVSNSERDTHLLYRQFRNTGRVVKNKVSDTVAGILKNPDAKFEEIADLVKGTLNREGLESGDIDVGLIWGGQVQGLIHDVPTCEALLRRIMDEATAIVDSRLRTMAT
jgi:nitronate monooxygenase